MSITVSPMGRIFKVEIEAGEEKLSFSFKQLDYRTKSKITSLVTKVEQGQYLMDAALQVFYNIQYGLKDVSGLVDEAGEPYKLSFRDKQKTALTDECTDEILGTPFSDNLQYAARTLANAVIPEEIVHPLTGKKIEGVEVIPPAKIAGVKKK